MTTGLSDYLAPLPLVAVLRGITPALLEEKLAVLAQWQLRDGVYVPVSPGANLSPRRGVRHEGDQLQMGLTKMELQSIERLLERLLASVDKGKIKTVEGETP